ncbi:MAG: hypothetical protein K8I82_24775 [Anaerolineae bacterium]|nr:hypothetical protein [Anaerolineae bacterium]
MPIEYCAGDRLLELLAVDDLILFAVTELGAVVNPLELSQETPVASDEEVQV